MTEAGISPLPAIVSAETHADGAKATNEKATL